MKAMVGFLILAALGLQACGGEGEPLPGDPGVPVTGEPPAVVDSYVADPAPDCAPVKQLAGCEGMRNAAGNYCFAAHNADDSLPLPTGCAVRKVGPNGTDAYVTSDCGNDCSYHH